MRQAASLRLRPLRPDDDATLDAVLSLNRSWVPHVGPLHRDRLVDILAESAEAQVAELAGLPRPAFSPRVVGFVIVLAPGASYDSPNYRWFEDRLAGGGSPGRFHYVDRIAVAPGMQGRGVGRRLYEAVFAGARAADAAEVTCEVNLDPPNPDSQAFHSRLGFVEVGRQWTYDDSVEVQLLARPT